MATYPLKNITIGGNTYQIQSGSDKYHIVLSGPSAYDLVDIHQFNNTNISTAYLAVVKNFSIVSNPGETLLDMINNDEQCVHLNYGSINASDLYLKSVEFTGTSTDPIDFYFESEVYENSGTAYVSQVVIRVSGASPYSIISITGKKIACGGGGGGSSTTILGLYDENIGSFVKLTNVSQSQTLDLQDITDINNPISLDDSDLLTRIQAGPCTFQDSRSSTYSITYDATAHKIGVIYNNVDQPYYMSLSLNYGTYWTVASNRSISLQ